MLSVEQWPELRNPVMVFAFTGWVDAGFAGSGTVAALAEALGAARQFASIDLSELLDLQQTRPTVRIAEGGVRAIDWPTASSPPPTMSRLLHARGMWKGCRARSRR